MPAFGRRAADEGRATATLESYALQLLSLDFVPPSAV
jgi:hypothetical protein